MLFTHKHIQTLSKLCGVKLVLAGGAMRDYILNNSQAIKDYDMFFAGTEANIEAVQRAFFPDMAAVDLTEYEDLGECIWQAETTWTTADGDVFPINFIALDLPKGDKYLETQTIDRCDFGICQIALCENNDIYQTQWAINDRKDKCFTIRPDIEDEAKLDRSIQRFIRIRERYPSYRLRITEAQSAIINDLAPFGHMYPEDTIIV